MYISDYIIYLIVNILGSWNNLGNILVLPPSLEKYLLKCTQNDD